MEYVICLILLFIGCVIRGQREQKIWYILEFFVLTSLMALRYRVGGDTQAYFEMFYSDYINLSLSNISTIDWAEENFQPLWIIFMLLSKTISNDFTVVQILHSLFVNSVIFWFVWKHTNYPFRYIIYYFLFDYLYFNTEIMRESISVCIFLLAYSSLKKRHYLKYYIMCLMAFGFHTSAIILFFLPLLYRFLNKALSLRTFFVIVLVLIILTLTPFVTEIISYIGLSGMENRYDSYTTYYKYNMNAYIKLGIDVLMMWVLIIIVNSNRFKNGIYKDMFALNMCLLISLFAVSIPISVRFLNYFKIQLGLLIVDNLIVILRHKFIALKIYIPLLTFAYISFFLVNKGMYYMKDMTAYNYNKPAKFYNLWYPYHSIFDKDNEAVLEKQNIFINSMKNQ